MKPEGIERIEIELLTEAIFRRYGHDFRHYSNTHLKRRLKNLAAEWKFDKLSELLPRILHDEAAFEAMLQAFSITVTEMFRNPEVYLRVRETVIPFLRTYPFIRVWVAGCASGEEAYSLAILFKEADLCDRLTIYATDFNDTALDQARAGVFTLDKMRRYSDNYRASGGNRSFSSYFHATSDGAIADPSLKRNIVFANHNLAIDSVFSEVHLIFCRNVLIYFNTGLQERVMKLFEESLVLNGFLCLGEYEEIAPGFGRSYRRIDRRSRIYQFKGIGGRS